MSIDHERPITMPDLVRIWAKAGVISRAPRTASRLTWADAIGLAIFLSGIAFCAGFMLGHLSH